MLSQNANDDASDNCDQSLHELLDVHTAISSLVPALERNCENACQCERRPANFNDRADIRTIDLQKLSTVIKQYHILTMAKLHQYVWVDDSELPAGSLMRVAATLIDQKRVNSADRLRILTKIEESTRELKNLWQTKCFWKYAIWKGRILTCLCGRTLWKKMFYLEKPENAIWWTFNSKISVDRYQS